ncbi:MAG: rhamnulokinase [Anaerolineae bacterium]|nr:rhamnulokinase [Anaerolineae bacterium]
MIVSHQHNFLAFDLGAESGRAVLGQFDGERLRLSEVHRFPNGPVRLPDGLHWDALRLWSEVKQGLALAIQEYGADLSGVGLDTWGVDFGLLDRDGALVSNPYHYRDSRTDGMLDEAFRRVPRAEIFEQTGIQFMQINSLYQLLSMVVRQSPALDIAETFLTMPDLFNYWLTGRKVCEFSIATTTQCYDPRQGDWARPLLEKMDIPTRIFPEIVPPGTVLGELLPSVAEEVGLSGLPVIAPACHDTGCAVAAVPAEGPVLSAAEGSDFVYISSGTWSLMGAELPEPVINEQSLAFDFTNEGGVGGTFRFLKNITGLWLVQECRRTWARQDEEFSYDDLTQMAAQAAPLQSVVDPDYPEFLKPGDMPARIRTFCQKTDQRVPHNKGAIVRCVLESLALKYRWVLERLEEILGRRLAPIHIVGGGTQNRLLNQFAADATGRQVITGPIEATAAGNVIMQAMALGHIGSLEEGRRIVRHSFDVATYEPTGGAEWDEAYTRFLAVMEQNG